MLNSVELCTPLFRVLEIIIIIIIIIIAIILLWFQFLCEL
jgi:hypothetical protein